MVKLIALTVLMLCEVTIISGAWTIPTDAEALLIQGVLGTCGLVDETKLNDLSVRSVFLPTAADAPLLLFVGKYFGTTSLFFFGVLNMKLSDIRVSTFRMYPDSTNNSEDAEGRYLEHLMRLSEMFSKNPYANIGNWKSGKTFKTSCDSAYVERTTLKQMEKFESSFIMLRYCICRSNLLVAIYGGVANEIFCVTYSTAENSGTKWCVAKTGNRWIHSNVAEDDFWEQFQSPYCFEWLHVDTIFEERSSALSKTLTAEIHKFLQNENTLSEETALTEELVIRMNINTMSSPTKCFVAEYLNPAVAQQNFAFYFAATTAGVTEVGTVLSPKNAIVYYSSIINVNASTGSATVVQ